MAFVYVPSRDVQNKVQVNVLKRKILLEVLTLQSNYKDAGFQLLSINIMIELNMQDIMGHFKYYLFIARLRKDTL